MKERISELEDKSRNDTTGRGKRNDAFPMIQQMLAIWPLVPLSFLNTACTTGSSLFLYC